MVPASNSSSLPQAKFTMGGEQGLLHGLIRHYEGDVALRGALGDGDDVNPFPAQSMEGPASHSRRATHVFSDHGNDGDFRVHGDMFHDFVSEILLEFAAQRFECAVRVCFGYDKTNFVL